MWFEGCSKPQSMKKPAPLLLVEDDVDDQELIISTLKDLGLTRDIVVCKDGEEALRYLSNGGELPFLIISDINMPRMDGIKLKQTIDSCKSLSDKAIPFVFVSTASAALAHKTADLKVQGIFEKGHSYHQLVDTLKIIVTYWCRTSHQN
jgi:CheY-like chemotaxis protein